MADRIQTNEGIRDMLQMASGLNAPPNPDLEGSVPSGSEVAKVFPWWAAGAVNMPFASVIGTINYVDFSWDMFGGFGASPKPARNNLAGPLKIHHIRFYGNRLADGAGVQLAGVTRMAARIKIGSEYLNSDFIPLQAFSTHQRQNSTGQLSQHTIKLPTPYYLQRGHTFGLEIRNNNAGFNANEVDISLRGWDPVNNTPVVMNKAADLPTAAGQRFVSFKFDEDRHAALRDIRITDICFGWTENDGSVLAPPFADPVLNYDVRIQPPTGPRWTEQSWTCLAGLVTTVGARPNYTAPNPYYFPMVHYQPEKPIILAANSEIQIAVRMLDATASGDDHIRCWVIGTQEG